MNGVRELIVKSFNDPSAGSPTETLLRLLLPLNDKVYTTSSYDFREAHPVNKSKVFTGSFIGRSDGRCVQRAGTYSMQADDLHLQGIPRWRPKITMVEPQHGDFSSDYPSLSTKESTRCNHHCSARAAQNI